MYLNNRLALPVNSSPVLVFPRQDFRDRDDSLRFAAHLISGLMEYKVMVDRRTLPPDCELCMEQYYHLFTSYRRPGLQKDSLITQSSTGAEKTPEHGHIIVASNNQFFVLNLTEKSRWLDESDILTQLTRISKMAEKMEEQRPPVGLFTSDGRTEWAKARDLLLKDPVNRESLELMERCVCVLCLDEPTGVQPTDSNRASLILHGGGHDKNGANRWSRSPSKLMKRSSASDLPVPQRLSWNCSSQILSMLSSSANNLQRLVRNLDMEVLRFRGYGKDFIKKQKMSPDAYIQVALQLAFYRCTRKSVSTYESASTRRFRHGRVENIRSSTAEALHFSRAMTDEGGCVQDSEKMERLRKAVDTQTHNTKMVHSHFYTTQNSNILNSTEFYFATHRTG
ncbi:Choline O-acetyltransferase [Bagarius yarrelli]|uniref:Choline O-acetyltransferase n=1 Tax=Bagarius yarrelli TaxID=175774 RepID=A0A556V9L2_BAGYA|nr:Choline O-acetyltransferase [Bagarius yarrelli]